MWKKNLITSLINLFAVLLLGGLWAVESLLGKLTLEKGFSPFTFPLIINCGSAVYSLILLLKSFYSGKKISVSLKDMLYLLLVGITLTFVPYLAIYMSLSVLLPYETSLISSLTPVISLILGVFLYGKKTSIRSVVSIIAGLIGVLFLFVPELVGIKINEKGFWYIVMLGVPLSYAVCGYVLRIAHKREISSMHVIFSANFISALLFLVIGGGGVSCMFGVDVIIFFIGTVVNIVAMIVMYRLAGKISPFFLSLSNYATVLFSLMLSMYYLSNNFSKKFIVSLVMIFISTLLAGAEGNDEIHNK